MIRNEFYDQLINSEPIGFIDPFTDLGEFDSIQMKFCEPVRNLNPVVVSMKTTGRYSG